MNRNPNCQLFQAYKLGMYGEKYVWFLAATTTGGWIFNAESFDKQHQNIDCELKNIIKAAEGFIVISKIDIRQDNRTTISGLVSNDIYVKPSCCSLSYGLPLPPCPLPSYAYGYK